MIGQEIELGEKIEWWSFVILAEKRMLMKKLSYFGQNTTTSYSLRVSSSVSKYNRGDFFHKLWASSAEAYIELEPAQVSSAHWQP